MTNVKFFGSESRKTLGPLSSGGGKRAISASAGVLLVAPTGENLKYVVQMHFPRERSTNNTAEYEGLLAGLRIAIDLGIRKLIVRGDSQLVVKEVNKDYQSPLMEAYVDEVRKLEESFDSLQAEHVPRAENNIADDLSKRAALKTE
ncbi:uncharacterized protein [Aegilops tauschii subsp. strangulata]|uniref:uncharacterized protein n=1 Tax=Aegilops tauschii subsp. strangulata TaxID=200361 RepID=UPI003CC8B83A